jgi:hypothetical protein
MGSGPMALLRCVSKRRPNRRVEPTNTERGRLRTVWESIGAVGEGVLAAPSRRLTRQPFGGYIHSQFGLCL